MTSIFDVLALIGMLAIPILLLISLLFLLLKKKSTKKWFKITGLTFGITLIMFILAVSFDKDLETSKTASSTTNEVKTKDKKEPEKDNEENANSNKDIKKETAKKEDDSAQTKPESSNKNNTETKKPNNTGKADSKKPLVTKEETEEFNNYVPSIKGGAFMKSHTLNGDEASISFVSNFEEYKSLNPKSLVTEEDYIMYWETGDAINKTLVDESKRLLKKFSFLEAVSMTLPFKGKVYSIHLTQKDAESISNPVQITKQERNSIVKKYVKVS
jgi:Skp family chaperone for outer membrane proteins